MDNSQQTPSQYSIMCSLIGNAPEHDVVQQGDLLSQLHCRQRLQTLGLRTLCLQAHTHTHTHARKHAHAHTQTSAHTHTHTHKQAHTHTQKQQKNV